MDWIEQLKEIARDPYRAVPQLVKSNLKNADGSRRLPVARPPVSPDDIKEFEGKSGMKLPNDLVRVYLEVGNGSFGPGYGLFQLLCDEKEIELYREKLIQDRDQFSLQNLWTDSLVESAIRRRRATSGMLNWNLLFWSNKTANDYRGRWPNHILQFCGAGCDLVGVIDIRTERVGFVQYEFLEGEPSKKIHGEPLENIIEWRSNSVKSWFESWLDGDDLMSYSKEFWETALSPLFKKHYPNHVMPDYVDNTDPTDLE